MLFVLQFVIRVYYNIVKVSSAKIVKVIKKYVIHILLVSCKAISKLKGHNFILVIAVAGFKRGKVF